LSRALRRLLHRAVDQLARIPGMPQGKPAGVPCVQLDARLRCRLFGQPERPVVCRSLQPRPRCAATRRRRRCAGWGRLGRLTAPPC